MESIDNSNQEIDEAIANTEWQELASGLLTPTRPRNIHHLIWQRKSTPNYIRDHPIGSVSIDLAVHSGLHAKLNKHALGRRNKAKGAFNVLLQVMDNVDAERTTESPTEVVTELSEHCAELSGNDNTKESVRAAMGRVATLLRLQIPFLEAGRAEF